MVSRDGSRQKDRSVYNAADVVGEAELRQKVNRQENETSMSVKK